MPLVQGTYQPSAFNPLLVPVSDAPPIDSDPYSPTYGQPTYSNLRPRANTPDVGTTAKGNPGQPGASVPTTDAPGASPPLPNVDASFTMAPAGAPKAQAKTPSKAAAKPAEDEVPDYLGNAKPQVDQHGKSLQTLPAASQSALAEGDVPDYLGGAQPQVDTHGKPATPVYTGQYLSSGTSAGAQAVGTPPVEGFVPGAAVQAAINTATDPGQRAAIAAKQLGIPLDRIIVDAGGGRMAAVGDNGVPYYIEPQPFFVDQSGITKTPEGQWQPMGALQMSPYGAGPSVTAPSFNAAMSRDISPNIGGAIPDAIQNILTYGPAAAAEAVGGPGPGALTAGGLNYALSTTRQMLANALTPDQSQAYRQPIYTGDRAKDAALNALLWYVPTRLGRSFVPPSAGAPVGSVPSAYAEHPMAGQQQLPGQAWGRPTFGPPPRNPLLPPPPEPLPSLPPQAAASPVPSTPGQPQLPLEGAPAAPAGEVPAIPPRPGTPGGTPLGAEPAPAPAVHDPFEGTADRSGPYAPTTPQEDAAQPTRLSPPTMPILTRQGVENRADEVIRHFATGGNTELDERDLITPAGLPQRTGNGGLAALWRYMATSTPEGINLIQNFKDRALAMRQAFTRNLVGTQEDLNAARGQRLAATRRSYDQAFGQGTSPVDAQPVVDQINTILRSPEGLRSDIAQPLRQIRDMFYERDPLTGQLPTDADGNPIRTLITDPERLYNVRRDINDSLRGPAATSTLPNARAAGHVMGDVLNNLDQTIASGAPNYPAYMQEYANASRGINAMEFLQGRNLTDASGNTTLAKVDGAIKEAERQRGVDPRRRPADSLTDDQMSQLYTLRDDLRRQANETKGKALGSDTAQNFATSAVANNLVMPAVRMGMRSLAAHMGMHVGGPLAEIPMLAGEGFIENALGGGETGAAAVRRAIIRRLLNEDGSGSRALGVPVGPSPPSGGL